MYKICIPVGILLIATQALLIRSQDSTKSTKVIQKLTQETDSEQYVILNCMNGCIKTHGLCNDTTNSTDDAMKEAMYTDCMEHPCIYNCVGLSQEELELRQKADNPTQIVQDVTQKLDESTLDVIEKCVNGCIITYGICNDNLTNSADNATKEAMFLACMDHPCITNCFAYAQEGKKLAQVIQDWTQEFDESTLDVIEKCVNGCGICNDNFTNSTDDAAKEAEFNVCMEDPCVANCLGSLQENQKSKRQKVDNSAQVVQDLTQEPNLSEQDVLHQCFDACIITYGICNDNITNSADNATKEAMFLGCQEYPCISNCFKYAQEGQTLRQKDNNSGQVVQDLTQEPNLSEQDVLDKCFNACITTYGICNDNITNSADNAAKEAWFLGCMEHPCISKCFEYAQEGQSLTQESPDLAQKADDLVHIVHDLAYKADELAYVVHDLAQKNDDSTQNGFINCMKGCIITHNICNNNSTKTNSTDVATEEEINMACLQHPCLVNCLKIYGSPIPQ